jgi:hypothetical protein
LISNPSKAMRVLKLRRLRKSEFHWFDYAFEFVIIFASLLLTFELDDYSEFLNSREKEKVYLRSLHDDFNKDIEQLNRRIIEYDTKLSELKKLKGMLLDFEKNADSIKRIFTTHLDYTFLYNPINSTFESLKSSGDLKLIDNQNFKVLLSELDKSHISVVSAGLVLQDFREGTDWNNLLISTIDQKTFKIFSPDKHFAVKLRNLILIYIKHAETYFFFLQGTLQKTLEAKDVLMGEITKRKIEMKA